VGRDGHRAPRKLAGPRRAVERRIRGRAGGSGTGGQSPWEGGSDLAAVWETGGNAATGGAIGAGGLSASGGVSALARSELGEAGTANSGNRYDGWRDDRISGAQATAAAAPVVLPGSRQELRVLRCSVCRGRTSASEKALNDGAEGRRVTGLLGYSPSDHLCLFDFV